MTVSGSGYSESQGVYVALCAVPEAGAPGPCTSGAAGASSWVSSNPPDYAKELATPYKAGGTFEVTRTLKPVIDTRTDCRVVRCAVMTRNDDSAPTDRSQDVFVPVSFAAASNAPVQPTASAPTAPAVTNPTDDDSGGGNGVVYAVVGLAVLVAAAGGIFYIRRRSVTR